MPLGSTTCRGAMLDEQLNILVSLPFDYDLSDWIHNLSQPTAV